MREVTGSIPAWLTPFRASGLAIGGKTERSFVCHSSASTWHGGDPEYYGTRIAINSQSSSTAERSSDLRPRGLLTTNAALKENLSTNWRTVEAPWTVTTAFRV
ncbi:hypothetical protein CYMTET_26244 [Cymbomonas tetramitiformis]|uniref:Uncharacterized protein n=1 Tax=Cymbomonas tetramitiformis TaxID=36881 RepID=A0AAE0KY45_9CHLO|nr:hypothetical protein CYMTET_26244 [Cymbomonas tetramitiformis]